MAFVQPSQDLILFLEPQLITYQMMRLLSLCVVLCGSLLVTGGAAASTNPKMLWSQAREALAGAQMAFAREVQMREPAVTHVARVQPIWAVNTTTVKAGVWDACIEIGGTKPCYFELVQLHQGYQWQGEQIWATVVPGTYRFRLTTGNNDVFLTHWTCPYARLDFEVARARELPSPAEKCPLEHPWFAVGLMIGALLMVCHGGKLLFRQPVVVVRRPERMDSSSDDSSASSEAKTEVSDSSSCVREFKHVDVNEPFGLEFQAEDVTDEMLRETMGSPEQ